MTTGPVHPRLGSAILAAGVILHLLFLVSLGTHWLDPLFLEAHRSEGQAGDYFGIYQAGDNLLQGRSIYAEEGRPEGSDRRVPYFFFYRYLPPTAYLAALDAWLLPPWPAYWLWVATTEALLLLLLLSLARLRSHCVALRRALGGLTLGFAPFYLEQWMGQFSFLMALFLWFVFRAEIERSEPPERERYAGLLKRGEFWSWSAAIALKNFPALLAIPYLRQGRWRRVGLAAVLVGLAALPYYAARPDDLLVFLRLNLLRPLPPAILGGSYGLVTLVRDLGWRLPGDWASRLLVLGPMDVYVGNIPIFLVSGLIVVVSLHATWRMGRAAGTAEALAVWTLAFFLIYKDVWEYHYVMAVPVAWLLALRSRSRWPLLWFAWLALPTPFVLYRGDWGALPVAEWPFGLGLLHFGWKVVPTVALYLFALRRLYRSGA